MKIMIENWVASIESLRSTALVHSNSWDAQLAIPNYPRYALLETNLGGSDRPRKGSNSAEIILCQGRILSC
ncbi:hypothetical protein TNCV_2985801 [Trichonephila clavipes]|nr:hypothetical protein TNCV_2985801 [Trichonephila clavipes]